MGYVNKKTYEVTDLPYELIECDDEIAYVIAQLNKKGYRTVYSCAGHNKVEYSPTTNKWDIHKLKEIKNKPYFKIINITDNYVYTRTELTETNTYITFEKNYFDSIPDGFTLEESKVFPYPTIRKHIPFYEKGSMYRRDDEDIDEDLKNGWKSLIKWVDSLEYINERVKER